MRSVILSVPTPQGSTSPRLAALTRHLKARLLDFDPGGPEVLSCDESTGQIQVRFPNPTPQTVAQALQERFGVEICEEKQYALFYLNETLPFEDLDYVWGCLFEILT